MNVGAYRPQGFADLARRTGMPFPRLAARLGITVEELDGMLRGDREYPRAIFITLWGLAEAADPGKRPVMVREELYSLCDRGLTAQHVADVIGKSHSVAQRLTARGKNPHCPVLSNETQADALRALVK